MSDEGRTEGSGHDEASRLAWQDLRQGIRRFVARRVRDPSAVDDLVQEILLRVHQHAGELRDAGAVTTWAYRIAHNVVVDHARRRRPAVPLEEAPEPVSSDGGDANINDIVAEWLRPMLGLLPSPYAEALVLTEIEGLTQAELAARLGISLSGAKSRVQRGRRLLSRALRDCCDFELDARGNVLAAELRSRPASARPARRTRAKHAGTATSPRRTRIRDVAAHH